MCQHFFYVTFKKTNISGCDQRGKKVENKNKIKCILPVSDCHFNGLVVFRLLVYATFVDVQPEFNGKVTVISNT